MIASPRHRARDLEVWHSLERGDYALATSSRWADWESEARTEIEKFALLGPCYIGVSWGKDSVVVAHLARDMGLPLAWVRVEPIVNPDCPLVRDAYLASHPSPLIEVEVWCVPHHRPANEQGVAHEWGWTARGTLEDGFRQVAKQAGAARHISGVRAAESTVRRVRTATYGLSTELTCAPIARWPTARVFAYLRRHDLPVHPAYACLGGTRWERDRLRVSALGRTTGQGRGRWEWEWQYYGSEMRALELAARQA